MAQMQLFVGHSHEDDAFCRSLVTALRTGTARMAALIEAQEATAMPGILADIDEHAERFRDGNHLAVPIAAVIASGMKP